jgi:peptidoglycan/xylan/chitin deacetylase (PgdA/CDA1 family)
MIAGGSALTLVALAIAAVVTFAGRGGSASKPHATPVAATGHTATPHPSPRRASLGLDARGNATAQRLATLALPIYCGAAHGNAVAFTFDDGPGPYTHYALKKLALAQERATFFVVGRSIGNFPGWLTKELPLAAIGDHTATHPVLPSLPAPAIANELMSTKEKIQSETRQSVYLFRPPYGALDPQVLATARKVGLLSVLWSVDSRDSLGANWAAIVRNVEAGLRPGAIVLMHENRGQTIHALTTLLPELHRRHLRSVTLPELLGGDPPSIAQVRRGRDGCGPRVRTSIASG